MDRHRLQDASFYLSLCMQSIDVNKCATMSEMYCAKSLLYALMHLSLVNQLYDNCTIERASQLHSYNITTKANAIGTIQKAITDLISLERNVQFANMLKLFPEALRKRTKFESDALLNKSTNDLAIVLDKYLTDSYRKMESYV